MYDASFHDPGASAEDRYADHGPETGGRDLVQRLFLRHSPAIRAFIRGLVPPGVDPDEVFQDTFLVVAEKADQYRVEADFLSWAFSIARMKVLSRIRDYQRDREQALPEEVMERLIADAPDSESMEHRMLVLRKCMSKLSPAAYRLLKMFYFDELSAGMIAQQLNLKLRTIYNGLNRARRSVRDCIERETAHR